MKQQLKHVEPEAYVEGYSTPHSSYPVSSPDVEVASERNASEAASALRVILKRELTQMQLRVGMLILFPFLLFKCGTYVLGYDACLQMLANPLVLIPFLLFSLSLPLVALKRFSTARQATLGLIALEDVHAIGPLIEALQFSEDRSIYSAAKSALIRLLPLLKASDAQLLTPNQYRMLSSHLSPVYLNGRSNSHVEFQVAILKAYEQVGDNSALQAVETLATMKANTAAKQRVRYAATECLPYLRERVEKARTSTTLLRASEASSADPASLLRPATEIRSVSPTELLRADTTSSPDLHP